MTQLLPNIFAVEVPENIFLPHLDEDEDGDIWLLYSKMNEIEVPPYHIKLVVSGQWEILFATKKVSESEAASVVYYELDISGVRAKNYLPNAATISLSCIASLQSLLRSHGLSTDKNYLLLKRIDL